MCELHNGELIKFTKNIRLYEAKKGNTKKKGYRKQRDRISFITGALICHVTFNSQMGLWVVIEKNKRQV